VRKPITFHRLAFNGLRYYWRTELTVLLGITVAAAVLVGAVIVGDSVRHTLRRLALARLGGTHLAMDMRNRFFHQDLGRAVGEELAVPAAAVLRLKGIALRQQSPGAEPVQVNRVSVLGVNDAFRQISGGAIPDLEDGGIAVSVKLAEALGVAKGDEVAVRVARPSLMPRDAPLSSRNERLSRRISLTVRHIVRDEHMGRFSLDANQVAPYNAFVDMSDLQDAVGLPDRANLLLVGAGAVGSPSPNAARRAVKKAWRPEHVGISLRGLQGSDVLQLESDRVFLDPETARAALAAHPGSSFGVLSYLVNSITKRDGTERLSTPYSFMTACAPSENPALSPVPPGMRDDEILINRWLAEHLEAGPGDRLTVAYYELLPSGDLAERTREFTVHGILEMKELATQPDLVPYFPGLTDVESCRQWDIGMPMDEELLKDEANEDYWTSYADTPKAIVTLAAGQAMWANRFGNLSAVRYSAEPGALDAVRAALIDRIDPAGLGLFFLPVRAEALKSVSEAMDFGGLFLGMSFFLIVAALMLTGLLFIFGIQQRSEEMGVLLAMGCKTAHVRRLFLAEGSAVALLGSAAGAFMGTGYARALIWGLSTHWKDAVAGSVIRYHAETEGIVIGAAVSFLCAVCTITLGLRRQAQLPPGALLNADLAGETAPPLPRRPVPRAPLALSTLAGFGAIAVVIHAGVASLENSVPAFFAAGTLLLLAGMGFSGVLLRKLDAAASSRMTIATIGARNTCRRRGRSLTVVGLLACGTFMVVAVSCMKEDAATHADKRWSGTGGFELFAESTLAVPDALGPAGSFEDFNLHNEEHLAGVEFVSLKVHDGDDAGCFNLNRAQAPRLLGVDPAEFARRNAFVAKDSTEDLWGLLDTRLPEGTVPGIVGDSNTAMWGLEKKVGIEDGDVLHYRDERGETFRVKLVGKLPMRVSVFQGTILVSARSFTDRFPSEEGYRVFLADVPEGVDAGAVDRLLSRRLDRVGFDVASSVQRLEEFQSVESAYRAMFLVLGGLGLLLGSVGVGVVVLRNVLERRGELAILRAIGFSRKRVTGVIVAEHWMLLVTGLAVGMVASVVAIWPSLRSPGSGVPYTTAGIIVAAVPLIGLVWIVAAARLALRGPLLAALREE